MIQSELLLADSARAETTKEHCLVCRHYRAVYLGEALVCDKRPAVKTIRARDWSTQDYIACADRAAKCPKFDDMRP